MVRKRTRLPCGLKREAGYLSLVLDEFGLVAVAVFVGTAGALAVGVALDLVAGGTAGAFVADGTAFAAALVAGLAGLEVAEAGVLLAVTVAVFAGAGVLVAGLGVTTGAVFGLAATTWGFAVPAVADFGAVFAAGLPLCAVVVGLAKRETALGPVAVELVALVGGFGIRDWAGAEATLVAVLAGGAALGAWETLVTGMTGAGLGGSVLALVRAAAVAVVAAAGGKAQVAAELG